MLRGAAGGRLPDGERHQPRRAGPVRRDGAAFRAATIDPPAGASDHAAALAFAAAIALASLAAVAAAAVAVAPTTALAALATPFEELRRMHLRDEFRRMGGYVPHMCRLPTKPLQIRPFYVLRSEYYARRAHVQRPRHLPELNPHRCVPDRGRVYRSTGQATN